MTYISENIVPGNIGKTFLTGITNARELQRVIKALNKIPGICAIEYSEDEYPHEMKICTKIPVPVKKIQDVFQEAGLHAVTKTLF